MGVPLSPTQEPRHAVTLDLSGFEVTSPPRDRAYPQVFKERIEIARAFIRSGEFTAAITRLDALEKQRHLQHSAEYRAVVGGLYGVAQIALGRADDGESACLHALADAKTSDQLESPLGVSLLNNLSVVSFQFHRRAQAAEAQLRQALDMIPNHSVDFFSQRPACLRNLGIVQESQGQSAAAARSLQTALNELGTKPREFLDVVDILAANRQRVNDMGAVESLRLEAFAKMRWSRNESPEYFVSAARELALLFLRNGDLSRLGPVVREQISAMTPLLGSPVKWRLIPPILFLALHHAAAGNWAETYGLLDWALELERRRPADFAGPAQLLRGVSAYFRREGLTQQAAVTREVYRILMSKSNRIGPA
ncbi:MAG: hypothetical protein RL417_703 [Pseudomonadota bacterium]|jgi:Tfp pilus assembly protein PilF